MELAVHLFLSLDGVLQSPGAPDETPGRPLANGGWVGPFVDEEFGEIVSSWFEREQDFLLGRVTYGIFKGFWPQVTDADDIVATKLNSSRKYVASSTLAAHDTDWNNTTVLDGDVLPRIRRLREAPAGSGADELQVHGSGALVRSLHAAGLVDVYRLIVVPVVLGAGDRLFDDGCRPSGFEVTEHRTTKAGLTYLELRPAELKALVPVIEDGRESFR